ncbi:MAG: DNA polymerase III subunit beta, partial [Spirochaetales bacterium]|nr:DNA polymerase III subunit beta [Spirochaetales bacterium]
MNGVNFENEENSIKMVATDGRRLSYICKNTNHHFENFKSVIIHPKILYILKKLCTGEGKMKIALTDKHFFVNIDDQKISSTLIEGQFPNYRKVIPENQKYEIIIDKHKLHDALKRVSLLVEQKSRRIYLTASMNKIVLNSEESEIGIAREEIECVYDGPEISIALNYIYLSDPLKEMKSNEVSIRFTETNKAISIFSIPESDYFHVIMPMLID